MKKDINKKLLSSVLAASAIMSSSGLAAVTGFLGGGSSYEALAAEGGTWFGLIYSKLTSEERGKLINFLEKDLDIASNDALKLLANYDSVLKYVDMQSILTEENMGALRQCYRDFVKLNPSKYTGGGTLTLPLPEGVDLSTEAGVKAFAQNIVDNFESNGYMSSVSTDNVCYKVLGDFLTQFDISVRFDDGVGQTLIYNDGLNVKAVNISPVFKIAYEMATQILVNIRDDDNGNDGNGSGSDGSWVSPDSGDGKGTSDKKEDGTVGLEVNDGGLVGDSEMEGASVLSASLSEGVTINSVDKSNISPERKSIVKTVLEKIEKLLGLVAGKGESLVVDIAGVSENIQDNDMTLKLDKKYVGKEVYVCYVDNEGNKLYYTTSGWKALDEATVLAGIKVGSAGKLKFVGVNRQCSFIVTLADKK